jgi:hypothetical protein
VIEFRITIRCKRQPETHAKIIRLRSVPHFVRELNRDYVEGLAGLLDGTSPWFIHPPGPDSTIGKCATCGGQLESSIEERDVQAD